MSQKRPAPVEAYAGVRYPDRPRRVFWGNRWRTVAAVEHEEERPSQRWFTVRLEPEPDDRDDTTLRLCYDYANDAWSVEPTPSRPPEATAK